MKGSELSKQFFWEIGYPAIERELPDGISRLAVGLSGGSQSHGNDDEISRDHVWGPGFTVFFEDSDYNEFGESLQNVLDQLPKEYLGYRDSRDRTCGVIEIDRYIKSCIGCSHPPENPLDWFHFPEEYLFEVTPKRLFHDAVGDVTARFEAFSNYPDDVWKKRLMACIAWVAEWGEKHLPRAEKRGDDITTLMYSSRFATYVMKSIFLLNYRYATYHKWLHVEFLKLPKLATEVEPLIKKVLDGSQSRTIWASKIVDILIQELESLGYESLPLTEDQQRNLAYSTRLMPYARSIRSSISHPKIKEMSTFIEMTPPVWKATWTWVHPSVSA
jgi:hypothetical protein